MKERISMETRSNKFRLASWFVFAVLVLALTAGSGMAQGELQPGGNTIAGPSVFKGRAGDSADIYQAQSRLVCVTLLSKKGSSRIETDGTVPVCRGLERASRRPNGARRARGAASCNGLAVPQGLAPPPRRLPTRACSSRLVRPDGSSASGKKDHFLLCQTANGFIDGS